VNDVVKAARLRIHSLSHPLVEAGMTWKPNTPLPRTAKSDGPEALFHR
jgi:hypothetical protein